MDQENPWAGQGPVLLDIGDGVGAVVVTMPAALDGVEVEARPPDHRTRRLSDPDRSQQPHHEGAGHDHHGHGHGHEHGPGHGHHEHDAVEHWPHVAVVGRPVGDRLVHSLVFPELTAGTYALCLRESSDTALTVEVHDGEVTFAQWPGTGPEGPAEKSGAAVPAGTGLRVEAAA